MNRFSVCIVSLLILLMLAATPAPAVLVYRGITIPGVNDFAISNSNDSGDLVGAYANADGSEHAFAYIGGHFSDIAYPGAALTVVTGLNNLGQVSGWQFIPGVNVGSSFIWQAGAFTPFDFPGSPGTLAFGINDAGQIAGDVYDQYYANNQAFLAGRGILDTYAVPGAPDTYGGPITNSGLRGVTGIFADGRYISYILGLDKAVLATVSLAGFAESYINGINDAGLSVLNGKDADGTAHGFLRDLDGTLTALAFPGAASTSADDIDSLGRVYGTYLSPDGLRHGFVAVDVPEPASIVLLAAGITAFAIMRRRHRLRGGAS